MSEANESQKIDLLLISESPLDKIGADYFAVDPWIRIPGFWSQTFANVTVLAPVVVRPNDWIPAASSWKVNLGHMRVEHHEYYFRWAQYFRLLPRWYWKWKKKLTRLASEHDVVVLRAPAPIGALVARCTELAGKPLVMFSLLDIETQPTPLVQARGLKRLVSRVVVNYLVRQERWIAGRCALIYAYSKDLMRRYEDLGVETRPMQDPHLRATDLRVREDTCAGPVVRILRICWLMPSKGLESLLDAMAVLVGRGVPVRLEIVGQERDVGYRQALVDYSARLGLSDVVTFSDWVPFDRVLDVYWRNDIQIISSVGEGTPRCIVEGFASGLPLVSTDSGGCADALTPGGNALLVPMRDADAMADAVERLIHDSELRKRLIRGGYEYARAATFDAVEAEMAENFRAVVRGRPIGQTRDAPVQSALN